jgi:hypothetical protein
VSDTTCPGCGEELPSELGCTVTTIELAGHPYPVLPHAGPARCEGCGTTMGGHHHGDCAHERCPRCGGLLAECGCVARMGAPTKEVFAWTIDEAEIASLSDSEAADAMDRLVLSMEEKITAAATKTGMTPPSALQTRYEIARTMLVGVMRELAAERSKPPGSG